MIPGTSPSGREMWGTSWVSTGDGAHGPITQAAIDAAAPALLARNYLFVRLRYYHDIVAGNRSQRVFLLGWVARINELFERITSARGAL